MDAKDGSPIKTDGQSKPDFITRSVQVETDYNGDYHKRMWHTGFDSEGNRWEWDFCWDLVTSLWKEDETFYTINQLKMNNAPRCPHCGSYRTYAESVRKDGMEVSGNACQSCSSFWEK